MKASAAMLGVVLVMAAAAVRAQQSNMELVYSWQNPDWLWPSEDFRKQAVETGKYNTSLDIPYLLEVDPLTDQIFVTIPNLLGGSPATLATVPRTPVSDNRSPPLKPYPSWEWQYEANIVRGLQPNCDETFVNIARAAPDSCGRLWVLDTGHRLRFSSTASQSAVCPFKLVVFDLKTDQVIRLYQLPTGPYVDSSVFPVTTVDTSLGCEDTFAYWGDSFGHSITTYSWKSNTAWVFRNNSLFGPGPPEERNLTVGAGNLTLVDGVYQVVLPAPGVTPVSGEGTVLFHSLAAYSQNAVPLSVLKDPAAAAIVDDPRFKRIGTRGPGLKQATAAKVDKRGVMFYGLGSLYGLACWDTRTEYTPDTQAIVTRGPAGQLYPGSVSLVDSREYPGDEEVWTLGTAWPRRYANFPVGPTENKVEIFRARASSLTRGTVCEPPLY